MENNEMEMKKLDLEALDPVAGGVKESDVNWRELTCPHCGGKYLWLQHNSRPADEKKGITGHDYYQATCPKCNHSFSWGEGGPDFGTIGLENMMRGEAEQGLIEDY